MDVELLDDIVAEASNDLLKQEVEVECEQMADVYISFYQKHIDISEIEEHNAVVKTMEYICMLTFGHKVAKITTSPYGNQLINSIAEYLSNANYVNVRIPLNFQTLWDASSFMNYIVRAFRGSIEFIRIITDDNEYSIIDNQLRDMHHLHYEPDESSFREIYHTIVRPFFPTQEEQIHAIEEFYNQDFNKFILRNTIYPVKDKNIKEVNSHCLDYLLGRKINLPNRSERIVCVSQTNSARNITDSIRERLFESPESESRFRCFYTYKKDNFLRTLFITRGPMFIEGDIWVTVEGIVHRGEDDFSENFEVALQSYGYKY